MTSSDAALGAGRSASSAWRRTLKIAVGLAALVAVVLLGRQLGGAVVLFAGWVQGLGAWGPIAFIVGYVVATVAFAPGWILTMAGGAIFGLAWGTVYVFAGATAGASLAFLTARYLARRRLERRIAGHPRFAAIDRAVGSQGMKIVFLLRLSPVFPFNLLNYALGLTQVRFRDYLVASLGMLPGSFLYVYYGKAAGDLATLAASGASGEHGVERWIFLGVGLLATVVVTAFVTRLARRALPQEVDRG